MSTALMTRMSAAGTPLRWCLWAALVASSHAHGVLAQGAAEAAAQPPAAEPAAQERVVRNVVVAQFTGDDDASKARAAVLRALAEHGEVEVLSLDDVSFAAQRFKADAKTAEGRAKLSAELGVHAWLDGSVDDDTAQLTLSAADGSKLAEVEIAAADSKQLDAAAGARMWDAFGPRLSPYEGKRREVLAQQRAQREAVERAERAQREAIESAEREQREAVERSQRAQRAVAERVEREQRAAAERAKREREAQPERARRKIAARAAELDRQKQLVHTFKTQRSAQRAIAQRKLSARLAELTRQAALVKSHEGGRLAKADPGSATAPLPEPKPQLAVRAASPAREALAAPLTNTSGIASESQYAGKSPTTRSAVSPATARWLAEQQALGFAPAGSPAAAGGP